MANTKVRKAQNVFVQPGRSYSKGTALHALLRT